MSAPDRKSHYVAEWRKHRGLTQERLAGRIGKTQGAISQLENFQIEYTQGMLEALADALNCTAADLVMRNPLDTGAPWSIWDRLQPAQRRQALAVLEALARTGTEG